MTFRFNLLFTSVDGIVADLGRKVVKLQQLSQRHRDTAIGFVDISAKYQKLADDRTTEAARADRVSSKIAELIT